MKRRGCVLSRKDAGRRAKEGAEEKGFRQRGHGRVVL